MEEQQKIQVLVFCFKPTRQVLALHKQRDERDTWDCVTGWVAETDRTLLRAVQRKVVQETGLQAVHIWGPVGQRFFRGINRKTGVIEQLRIHQFFVQVHTNEVHLSSQHDAYRWVDLAEPHIFTHHSTFNLAHQLQQQLQQIPQRPV